MIANEPTLHKRPNDTETNNYISLYGLHTYFTDLKIGI